MPDNNGYRVTGADLSNATPIDRSQIEVNVIRGKEVTQNQQGASETPPPVSTFGADPTKKPTGTSPSVAIPSNASPEQIAELAGQIVPAFKSFQQLKMETDLDKKIKTEVFLLAKDLVSGPPVSPMGPCSPPPGAVAAMVRLGPVLSLPAISPPANSKPETSAEDTEKLFAKLKPLFIELLNKKLVEYQLVSPTKITQND